MNHDDLNALIEARVHKELKAREQSLLTRLAPWVLMWLAMGTLILCFAAMRYEMRETFSRHAEAITLLKYILDR